MDSFDRNDEKPSFRSLSFWLRMRYGTAINASIRIELPIASVSRASMIVKPDGCLVFLFIILILILSYSIKKSSGWRTF